jgi:protein-disulfide isomerase
MRPVQAREEGEEWRPNTPFAGTASDDRAGGTKLTAIHLMISRRKLLLGSGMGTLAALAHSARAQDAGQWFAIKGDDGKPVPNLRLPVEVTSELDELGGVIWTGADERVLTLVEFFDYNCPYCRAAMRDIHGLLQETPDLRLGLVNNPILSADSADAARVELAVLRLGGPERAYEFHRRLFERRGRIGRDKALDVATSLGAPAADVARLADAPDIQGVLADQMRLAASLGMAATPSFLIAGAGLLGYPGPVSLKEIVGSVRDCGQITC